MTEILCEWLNNSVRLSKKVEKADIARDFANGYLFGEIFQYFQLQDDFGSFSSGNSSNAKLNNFMKLEPTFHLLEIPFNTNIAYEVMTLKYGVATRLLYQMYVSLQRKVKNNLTGAAMQTMRASAPVKLESIESGLYKERLKTLIPRESDLTLGQVSMKFKEKREENEKKEIAARYKRFQEFEAVKQEQRKVALEKSRMSRLQQTELLAKIQAATVHIPKPPPSKTLQAIRTRREMRSKREAAATHTAIRSFEQNLKKLVAPAAAQEEGEVKEEPGAGGAEYLDRIKTRLVEERAAREERAKRRRKVLVDQMKAHHAQQESHRQEQIVQRLMRQSQMERRIAVQLMQVRSEKDNIRKNRIFREKQYEERRLKDFQDALDLEAKLAKLAKDEYNENAEEEAELHNRNMAKKRQEQYRKHYQACGHVMSDIVDFASKIIEYRNLTERKVPAKLVREWKELFLKDQPLYEKREDSKEAIMESQREEILNSQDFAEYKNLIGEWKPGEDVEFKKLPASNILGHILHRMFNMVHPPETPPTPPKFPDFPVKAAIMGKMFAGKSTILERLTKAHNIALLRIEILLSVAIEAFQDRELEASPLPDPQPEAVETTVTVEPPTPHEERGVTDEQETEKEASEEAEVEEEKPKPKPLSQRAVLGGKAMEYLENGEPVPDDILVAVVVDEIHKIPEGRGWILDGFPQTVQQAVLLEKAITGNDVSALAMPVKRKVSKSSNLVADPRPQEPPAVGLGAIDVVLILDVTDETVLKRSLGRTYERKNDVTYHEEFSPAPLGSRTGIGSAEQIIPVEDQAFDKDQVQNRISSFHDNWKKLDNFYSKLSMIQHVDGDQERDGVFGDAEKLLFQTLDRIRGKEEVETPIKEAEEEQPKASPQPAPQASQSPSPTRSKPSSPTGSKRTKSAKSDRGKSPEKGSKSRSRSGSRKSSAKEKKSRTPTPPAPQEPVVDEGPPPPKPGEPNWEFVDEPLPMECAKVSVPMWDNVENTYKNSCMHIFHRVRDMREGIVRYTYQSRNDFRAHLRRPDPKQTFVSAWQKDFNEIADDVRGDEETKSEMHQRLLDLRERLWDICDTKKEEAEAERAELMSDGWLEDNLGLLINQYLSLMQVEMDRFQDTTRVIKDYYTGMQNKIPSEETGSNARLPLVELDVEEPMNPAASHETMGSDGPVLQESGADLKKGAKKGKEEEPHEGEADGRVKIPLIQRGATFSLTGDEGGKGKKGKAADTSADTQAADGALEEKTIADAYNTGVAFAGNLVQTLISAKEAEVEEERRLKEEEEKAKMAAAAPVDKKGGKKAGKSAKGKGKGKSKSPTPTPPSPADEMSEEDKKKLQTETNMREEYFASLRQEEERVKCTLALIKQRTVMTLAELKEAVNTSYAEMLEWLGTRYLAEMKSIEKLTETGQHAIESATKLKHEMLLTQDEFVVNLEVKVARTPSPPPLPPPVEVSLPEVFTVIQLNSMLHQFQKVSPSGSIANKSFTELLSDTALLTHGLDALPEVWVSISYSQLTDLCNLISPECEYVDWRKFLLAVSKPWPAATSEDLIEALNLFTQVDIAENGWITEDQYADVKTWLHSSIPADNTDGIGYNRMKHLHNFFFALFADWEQTPARLDYVNMLMYFAMDTDALQGYIRALSVTVGVVFPRVYRVTDGVSSASKAEVDDSVSDATSLSNLCVKAESAPQPLISARSWWLVQHHGSSKLDDSHRFSISDDPEDKFSLERLNAIYETLESPDGAPIPFQLLLQHPSIQDAILSTKRYQLPDVGSVFDKQSIQGTEGEDTQSMQAASIG